MERLKKALCLERTPSSAELLRLLQQIAAEDATRRGGGQALLLPDPFLMFIRLCFMRRLFAGGLFP